MLNLWSKVISHIKAEDVLFSGTILDHQPSGKNNYRLSGKRMFKKDEVKNYETYFMIQMGSLMARQKFRDPIDKKILVALIARVYNKNWRRDVDTILFCDLLQRSGVLENDRQIRLKLIDGIECDAKNPRIEFFIVKI